MQQGFTAQQRPTATLVIKEQPGTLPRGIPPVSYRPTAQGIRAYFTAFSPCSGQSA
jgi:hypothetical protein